MLKLGLNVRSKYANIRKMDAAGIDLYACNCVIQTLWLTIQLIRQNVKCTMVCSSTTIAVIHERPIMIFIMDTVARAPSRVARILQTARRQYGRGTIFSVLQ